MSSEHRSNGTLAAAGELADRRSSWAMEIENDGRTIQQLFSDGVGITYK